MENRFDKNFLLGVGITNTSQKNILEFILENLKTGSKKYYIVTPNPEILVFASKNKEFKNILNNARLALPDGTGVIWAGKILGKNFKERVTGTDLVKNLCKIVSKQPITVGFLGGGPKIAEKTAECLSMEYPGLKVVFVASEWSIISSAEVANKNFLGQQADATQSVHQLKPRSAASENFVGSPHQRIREDRFLEQRKPIDILFVAFGFPKQEIWMSENLPKLPVKVMVGVGGAFDYISGKVPRAPLWVQKAGFEWLYRLIRQPWRLKRQLALVEFIYLVLKEKFLGFNPEKG